MRIEIVRGGGLAGLSTRTVLDGAALDPAQAGELGRRVQAAALLGGAPPVPAERHPDELLYALTVEDDGRSRTSRFSEATLPEAVRQLIAWVDGRPEREEALGS